MTRQTYTYRVKEAQYPDFVPIKHIVTAVHVSKVGDHATITVYSRGASAGAFIVNATDAESFVSRLLPNGILVDSHQQTD